MLPAATRPHDLSTLYLAFELGNAEWKLAMTTRIDQAPLVRTIPARVLKTLEAEIARAKTNFGLPASAPVRSCYEAGRDGFWLHRYLVSRGIINRIVDSSSIEVNRRRRRTKTDRLDAGKLVTMLIRAEGGEQKVWSVVNVPTPAEEDRRQVHRELLFARRDRGRHTNRIKGLLAGQGVPLARIQELPTHLVTARRWDGTSLPPLLCTRLEREWEAVVGYTTRIRALKQERRALLRVTDDPAIAQVRQLNQLRGIGIDSAWLYVMEFFAWRQFRNRRQVGGLAGLTDTHYQSGDLQHEQGISKAGNRWVRALAINTAWAWLRFQPKSALARWYQKRFGKGNSRMRKIGIVALARKLLIAFWRYLDTGLIPEGAVLRA
ncbi:MAG: IS110 family transposase [Gemmatimonadota bacterium]|nr:IS110 family transposase [Gemmatimonadota bacterium]